MTLLKGCLKTAQTDFDVKDCFEILKATAQTVCPTVVSMVVDVTNYAVFWCKNREWNQISVQEYASAAAIFQIGEVTS